MTLQSSGTIKFSEIENDFGQIAGSNNRKIGSYRVSDVVGGITYPLDTGMPQSGAISFSDFYSKRLNILVDFYTGAAQDRVNGKTQYDAGATEIIGPGTVGSLPNDGAGKRVIINVNKQIGSAKGASTLCALITGNTWNTETDAEGCKLQIDVGPEGIICGAGGDGGLGGYKHSSTGSPSLGEGFPGSDGTSAIGVQHDNTDVNVVSGGQVINGFGGGGGAPGFEYTNVTGEDHEVRGWGGGGGGGAGIPVGEGAENYSSESASLWGQDGSFPSGGEQGGAGGEGTWTHGDQGCSGGICAGDGGRGGDQEADASAGGPSRSDSSGPGAGGSNGAAIRRTSGLTVTITNAGTISGATDATGIT